MKIAAGLFALPLFLATVSFSVARDGCFDFTKLPSGVMPDTFYGKVTGGYFVMKLFGFAGAKEPMIVDWGDMHGLLAESFLVYGNGKSTTSKAYLSTKGTITYSSPEGSATNNFEQAYVTKDSFELIKSEKLPASPKLNAYAFSAPRGKKFDALHIVGTLVTKLCLNRAGTYPDPLDVSAVAKQLQH